MAGRWSRGAGERGASIVELAFIAPVLALIVMGVLDLARGYQLQIRLENAAREGAAFARVQPNDVSCPGDADIVGRVTAEEERIASQAGFRIVVLGEDAGGAMTVPVTGCGGTTVTSGERVRVEAIATFDVLTPMVERIVGSTIDISGAAEVEAQR